MTEDIEILFNDLDDSIAYCKEKSQSKQAQIPSFNPSASSSSSSTLASIEESSSQEDEYEGRGHLKRGFFQRYVGHFFFFFFF